MQLKWLTETALAVAGIHHNDVVQACTLEKTHQGKVLRANGVSLLVDRLCLGQSRRSFDLCFFVVVFDSPLLLP